MLFSGKNVRCNYCGTLMVQVDDEWLECPDCGRTADLTQEDPEAPGCPMQECSPNGYDDYFPNAIPVKMDSEYERMYGWNDDPEDM